MIDFLNKKLTKDYREIPLFFVNFDLEHYKEHGDKGSCNVKLHPTIKDDEYISEQLKGLIDYIRDNYNMDDLV